MSEERIQYIEKLLKQRVHHDYRAASFMGVPITEFSYEQLLMILDFMSPIQPKLSNENNKGGSMSEERWIKYASKENVPEEVLLLGHFRTSPSLWSFPLVVFKKHSDGFYYDQGGSHLAPEYGELVSFLAINKSDPFDYSLPNENDKEQHE